MRARNESPRDLPFPAGSTVLLLVDMQEVWVRPGLDPHLTADQGAYYYARLQTSVIPKQQRLLAAFRASGANVVHTIIRSLTRDGRDRSLDHKLSGMHLACDDPRADVIRELAPQDNEIVLPKTSSGVFNSTAIDYVLRNLGVTRLVICGVVTDQCVDMAVRDAADRGYLVSLVEDACATHSAARHHACLDAIGGYCHVTDTDAVLARLAEMTPS